MLTNPPSDPAGPRPSPEPSQGPAGKEVVPFQVGELVAQRYRVVKLLSEDSLGWLFEVSETNPMTPPSPGTAKAEEGQRASADAAQTPLALRLLRPRFAADGVVLTVEALQAWRSQLALLRDLRHAGVVPVQELCTGDEHGRVYAVRSAVELEGQSLAAFLQERPGGLHEPDAVRLCAAIGEAVEGAHHHGVLHLALSPSRIFLVPSGDSTVVKVPDFALLPPLLAPQYCEPGYLSPEQVEGQPCDRRTDQFAVAVIFYEMLSGQPAFIGAPDEPRETILTRVISEDPLPLALSRPIELALARALSRSRSVRFPGLREFVCALGVDGVAWSAVRPPGPARSQLSPPPVPVRRPLYVPVAVGAAAALLILGILSTYSHLLPWRRPVAPGPPPGAAEHLDMATLVAENRPGPTPAPPLAPPRPQPFQVQRAPIPPLRMLDEVVRPAASTAPPLATAGLQPPDGARPTPAAAQAQTSAQPPTPTPPSRVQLTDAELQINTGGAELSSHHRERIRFCLNLIHARPPFTVLLDGFNDTLYVNDGTPNPEIRLSTDFRNCLKNEVRGNIGAKSVVIKAISKGKSAP